MNFRFKADSIHLIPKNWNYKPEIAKLPSEAPKFRMTRSLAEYTIMTQRYRVFLLPARTVLASAWLHRAAQTVVGIRQTPRR